MTKRQIFLIFIIASFWFVFKVLSTIPSTVVFSKLNEKLAPQAMIINPQGSIWSGSAEKLALNIGGTGQLAFEQPQWKLHVWRLFLAQLALDIKTQPGAQMVNAEVVVSLTGNISVKNLDAKMSAALISKFFPTPAQIQGDIQVKSAGFDFKDKKLLNLADDSEFRWLRGGFNVSNQNVLLGDYVGKLSQGEDAVIDIKLMDLDAALKANGTIKIALSQPPKYSVDLLLKPTPEFPAEYTEMLSMVGAGNAQGEYRIKRTQ